MRGPSPRRRTVLLRNLRLRLERCSQPQGDRPATQAVILPAQMISENKSSSSRGCWAHYSLSTHLLNTCSVPGPGQRAKDGMVNETSKRSPSEGGGGEASRQGAEGWVRRWGWCVQGRVLPLLSRSCCVPQADPCSPPEHETIPSHV